MEVQISFQVSALISFGHILRSRIAGSGDSSIFSFLRKPHTVFYNGSSHLQSQQCTSVLFVHIHTGICYLFVFSRTVFKTGVRWYLIVTWICISLMTSDDKWASFHIPVDLASIFFGEIPIQVLCPFFIWVTCLLFLFVCFSLFFCFVLFCFVLFVIEFHELFTYLGY